MVEGGLVPFVGFLWRLDTNWKACRSEIPWCKRRPSEYVWEHVRFATQPLESPDDLEQLAGRRSRACAPGTRSCSPATSRTGTTTSPSRRCGSSPRSGATTSAGATRPSSSGSRSSRRVSGSRARGTFAAGGGAGGGRGADARDRTATGSGSTASLASSTRSPTAARIAARRSARRDGRDPARASEGRRLALGASASVVRCPWHKWEFEIASGRSLVDARLRVRRYAVRVEDEHVVVTLDHPERDAPSVTGCSRTSRRRS